jgi:hypothetical protein
MGYIHEQTNDYQDPWVVVEMVPGMSCKPMKGINNECNFCEDGIDWEKCTNLGWKADNKRSGMENEHKEHLDHFREVVFKPILENYSPNLEREGITAIFLTIAPRHAHYEFPKKKCEDCQGKMEDEPCEECEQCGVIPRWKGHDTKFIVMRNQPEDHWKNPKRKTNCIPLYPIEMRSLVDVQTTGVHIFKCLSLIEEKYPNRILEVNTYTGSSNFGLRSYFHGLLQFVANKDSKVSKWIFFDYFNDKFIGTDERIPTKTEAQKKKRDEKVRSGFHVISSIPSSLLEYTDKQH